MANGRKKLIEQSLRRIDAAMRTWVTKSGIRQRFLEIPSNKLHSYVAGAEMKPGAVATNMHLLHYWKLKHSIVEIIDEKVKTYEELSSASEYLYWRLMIFSQIFQAEGQPIILFNEAALGLALLLTVGALERARDLGRMLLRYARDQIFHKGGARKVGALMLKLIAEWMSAKFDESDFEPFVDDLGGYKPIADTWCSNNTDEFANAIYAACDYHMDRSKDSTNDEMYEFEEDPYRVLPVEILAVLRLRESMGLISPDIEHPLMERSTGRLYPTAILPKDELLDMVLKRVFDDLSKSRSVS
jgi:hypothetical protein